MTTSAAFMTPQIREALAKMEQAEVVNLDRAIVAAKQVEQDSPTTRLYEEDIRPIEEHATLGCRARCRPNGLEIDRRFGASSAATGRQSEPRKFDRTPSPRRSGPVLSVTAICIRDWLDHAQSCVERLDQARAEYAQTEETNRMRMANLLYDHGWAWPQQNPPAGEPPSHNPW